MNEETKSHNDPTIQNYIQGVPSQGVFIRKFKILQLIGKGKMEHPVFITL